MGGGIIGLSIAYYLSEKSPGKITIIEQSQPASKASKGNAGGISYMGILPNLLALKPLIDLSLKLFAQLSRRLISNFDFEKTGSIMVPQPSEGSDSIRTTARAYTDIGVAARVTQGRELRELSPLLDQHIDSAIFFPEEARGNSAKLSEGLVKALLDREQNVLSNTTVNGFEVEDHSIRAVKTERGLVQVKDKIVLAAGPWSHGLGKALGQKIPVEPAKGHMTYFQAIPQRLGPTVIGKDIVIVQSSDGRMRSGGFVDMVGFDDGPEPTRVRSVIEQTYSLLPILQKFRVIEEWAGLRPRTPDDLPILGNVPTIRNLYVATGHFKKGFCLSQATGLLMAELITGRKPSLSLEAFSADRFL